MLLCRPAAPHYRPAAPHRTTARPSSSSSSSPYHRTAALPSYRTALHHPTTASSSSFSSSSVNWTFLFLMLVLVGVGGGGGGGCGGNVGVSGGVGARKVKRRMMMMKTNGRTNFLVPNSWDGVDLRTTFCNLVMTKCMEKENSIKGMGGPVLFLRYLLLMFAEGDSTLLNIPKSQVGDVITAPLLLHTQLFFFSRSRWDKEFYELQSGID
ncbi:hypothetical protein Ahy_A08g038736 isoform C [Arachis hypogaea]|uniref:Uncharacterized protein n=1 Tax=Arachis hypogaea TaxID=3818 RepID=A0A445BU83_ARAHY|nr:hypothetical protein Ahy_A08g038736 isoform C [Arachis hypogaea]